MNVIALKIPEQGVSRRYFESRVQEWRSVEKHYIMTIMATKPTKNWTPLVEQTAFTDDHIRQNAPASLFFPGAYWIHEEIVRPKENEELTFLTVWGQFIWRITGTLQGLFDLEKTVFRGRQLGAISFWLNQYKTVKVEDGYQLQVGSVQPICPAQEVEIFKVFPIITSPILSQVQWFEGEGPVKQKFYHMTVEYWIMSKPKTTKKMSVPKEVQQAWQSTYYQRKGVTDLLSLDYYEENFSAYTDWSFELHEKQIKSVLRDLPRGRRVVAPGDGWGVVKSALKEYNVISTDIVRGQDFTEEVEATLARVQADDLLVLSYLWNLLSPDTKTKVMELPCEVVIIDAYPFLQGWHRVGEGIFINKKVPWISFMGLSITPEGYHEQALAFSENLLRLEFPSDSVKTNAYYYYKAMRPLAPFSRHGPAICSTIEEAVKARSPAYLAPIGKLYSEPILTSVTVDTSWSIRTVYKIPVDQVTGYIRDQIRQRSHWYDTGAFFLFCFSFPTVVNFKIKTPTRMLDYSISVTKKEEEVKDAKFTLTSVTKNHLIWKSYKVEPIVWKRTPFSQWCAYQYLSEDYGRSARGWKKAIFGAAEVVRPEMTEWEEEVLSYPMSVDTLVPVPRFGPMRFDDDWWTHQQCEVEIIGMGVMLFPTDTTLQALETTLTDMYGMHPEFDVEGKDLTEIMIKYGWQCPISVNLVKIEREIVQPTEADKMVDEALSRIRAKYGNAPSSDSVANPG